MNKKMQRLHLTCFVMWLVALAFVLCDFKGLALGILLLAHVPLGLLVREMGK